MWRKRGHIKHSDIFSHKLCGFVESQAKLRKYARIVPCWMTKQDLLNRRYSYDKLTSATSEKAAFSIVPALTTLYRSFIQILFVLS